MVTVQELESRRDAVLQQLRSIRSLRRGGVSEQFLRVRHKGKKEPALRGPYYVLQRREGKRVISQRLCSSAEVAEARADVAAHKRFVELCHELELLTEQLGHLARQSADVTPEKKRRKSRSNRTQK